MAEKYFRLNEGGIEHIEWSSVVLLKCLKICKSEWINGWFNSEWEFIGKVIFSYVVIWFEKKNFLHKLVFKMPLRNQSLPKKNQAFFSS